MSLKKRNILIPIAISLLSCGLIALLFDYYYCFNDDKTLADIFSGVYAPAYSTMGIYVRYPLSLFLSILYRLVPIPWYPIYIQICAFGSIAVVLGTVLKLADQIHIRIFIVISGMAVIFSLLLYDLVYSQYTVIAGLMSIASVFAFTLAPFHSDKRRDIPSIVLCVLLYINAFCLRKEIALLLLPFFAVGVVMLLQDHRGRLSKDFLLNKLVTLLAIIIGILLCALCNKLAYSSPAWTSFLEYNDARTQVYDYTGYPSYEAGRELYDSLGLTANDFELIDNYDLALKQDISADILNRIADHSRPSKDIREVIAAYRYQLRFCDQPYSYIALALYGILVLMLLMRGRIDLMLQPIVLLGGRSLLWCYLLYKGRYPARIIHPLYLMEIAMLLAMIIMSLHLEASKYLKGMERALILVTLVVLLCLIPKSLAEVALEKEHRERTNIAYQEFKDYAQTHPDEHFFIDVYSSIHLSDKLLSSSGSQVSNYTLLGGWMLESPTYHSKLKYWGYGDTSVAEALMDSDDAYLVITEDSEMQWLSDFYQENYNTVISIDNIITLGETSDSPLIIIKITKAD